MLTSLFWTQIVSGQMTVICFLIIYCEYIVYYINFLAQRFDVRNLTEDIKDERSYMLLTTFL